MPSQIINQYQKVQFKIMNEDAIEPPFIQGLKAAKNVLLSLREKKIKDLPRTVPMPIEANHLQLSNKENKQLPTQQNAQEKQIILPEKQQKKYLLSQKINQIGRQLHDCHTQNETYQVIFNEMTEYYRQNLKIVEHNEKLKHKSYQLKQQIEQYKKKMKFNKQIIQQHRSEQAHIRSLTAEHLKNYLVSEIQRSSEQPLPRTSQTDTSNIKITTASISSKQEKQIENKLTLRWQEMAKQTSKKPAVSRKQYVQQDDIRRTFYQSEVYNL